jgi:hypothetical protein
MTSNGTSQLEDRLYMAAKALEEAGTWSMFLTRSELLQVRYALQTRDNWEAFMQFTNTDQAYQDGSLSMEVNDNVTMRSSTDTTDLVMEEQSTSTHTHVETSTTGHDKHVEKETTTNESDEQASSVYIAGKTLINSDGEKITPSMAITSAEKQLAMMTAACRARQVLFDQIVYEIMPSGECCDSILDTKKLKILDRNSTLNTVDKEAETTTMNEALASLTISAPAEEAETAPVVPVVRNRLRSTTDDDDDDYDFDEDVPMEESKPEAMQQDQAGTDVSVEKKEGTSEENTEQDKKTEKEEMVTTVMEKKEPDVLETRPDQRPFSRYYFTLEEDAQVVHVYEKLMVNIKK